MVFTYVKVLYDLTEEGVYKLYRLPAFLNPLCLVAAAHVALNRQAWCLSEGGASHICECLVIFNKVHV